MWNNKNITWANIRHTAFRLTPEDRPELRDDLDTFADNGHTSGPMLTERYLRHIDREATAKKAQESIAPGKWSLIQKGSAQI